MFTSEKHKPDPQIPFPQTLAEAKDIIADAFKFTNWNDSEQRRYLKMLGFSKNLDDLNISETRVVINDLHKNRMVLFKN